MTDRLRATLDSLPPKEKQVLNVLIDQVNTSTGEANAALDAVLAFAAASMQRIDAMLAAPSDGGAGAT